MSLHEVRCRRTLCWPRTKENLRVAEEQQKQNSEEIFSTLTGAEMWLNVPQNSVFQHSLSLTLQIQNGQGGFEIPPLLWTLQISISLEKDLKPEGRCSCFESKRQQGKGEAKGLLSITRETARADWAGDPLAWMWDWTALSTASTIETWNQKQISFPNHSETCNKVNCQTASLAFLLQLSKGIGFKHQCC